LELRADLARGLDESGKTLLLQGVRTALATGELFDARFWPDDPEAKRLSAQGIEKLSALEIVRLNRITLESVFPEAIAASLPNQHTKLGIPGFKEVFLPLGVLYVFFVIFTITAMSNAVNLTDGLDGLAAGTSMVSIFTFAAIAYVVSRADWSSYLYLTYVPEASELFVFAAAVLGTTLGFLWFNVHPAEVFMGDTGSLALGGALASMAILTKQELLLPIVAGLFVLEALSVTIQVASFKLTGKRVFRMAPLHHHFELLGWAETKVTLRFWIIAFLFALLSLSTLKLR
jgi:phospho-N-acetylmuramoyl-pentapeptide-transferase